MSAYQRTFISGAPNSVIILKGRTNVCVRVDLFWILQTIPPAKVHIITPYNTSYYSCLRLATCTLCNLRDIVMALNASFFVFFLFFYI